jgi:hypothetical protein
MNAKSAFVGSYVLAIVLLTWLSFSSGKGMPQPVRIVKTTVVWTILAVISDGSPKMAAILGYSFLPPLFFLAQSGSGTQSTAQETPLQVSPSPASGDLASLATTGAIL